VIEHDALLAIHPALTLVTFAIIAFRPKGRMRFRSTPFLRVENFPLLREMIDKIGDVLHVSCSRRNDGRSLGFATRDFTGRTLREKIVELRLRHFQHF